MQNRLRKLAAQPILPQQILSSTELVALDHDIQQERDRQRGAYRRQVFKRLFGIRLSLIQKTTPITEIHAERQRSGAPSRRSVLTRALDRALQRGLGIIESITLRERPRRQMMNCVLAALLRKQETVSERAHAQPRDLLRRALAAHRPLEAKIGLQQPAACRGIRAAPLVSRKPRQADLPCTRIKTRDRHQLGLQILGQPVIELVDQFFQELHGIHDASLMPDRTRKDQTDLSPLRWLLYPFKRLRKMLDRSLIFCVVLG